MKNNLRGFKQRGIAFLLAIVMVALTGIPTSGARVKADTDYLPMTSAEVDDTTESGRLLKEILLYEESQAGAADTPSVPFEDWGEGLTGDAWALEETKLMAPVQIELNRESMSPEMVASLESEGYTFDEEGNANQPQQTIDRLIELSLENVCTILIVDDMISWGVGKLMDWIFGFDDNSAIEDALRQINAKADNIKKQLDIVDKKLDKILGALEAKKYRDDLTLASTTRAALYENVEIINLNLAKTDDIKDKNQKISLRKQFVQDINSMKVDGNSFYVATMKYSDILTEKNNNTGKNIFDVAYYITKAGHFPWDRQEAAYYGNMTNYYMAPYMQALGYSRLSLMYQISLHPVGSHERINYETIYERMLSGNKKMNVTSKAQRMLQAVQGAEKIEESPVFAVLNKKFSGYPQDHWYIRETSYGEARKFERMSKEEGEKWIDFLNHPNRHNINNVNLFFSNILAHSKHLVENGYADKQDGFMQMNCYILSDGSYPDGDLKGYPSFKEDERIFGTRDLYTVYKDLAGLKFPKYQPVTRVVSRSKDGKSALRISGSDHRIVMSADHAEYDLKTGEFTQENKSYNNFVLVQGSDKGYQISHDIKSANGYTGVIMVVKDYYAQMDNTELPTMKGIVSELDTKENTFRLTPLPEEKLQDLNNVTLQDGGIMVQYEEDTPILINNDGDTKDVVMDDGDTVEITAQALSDQMPSADFRHPNPLVEKTVNHLLGQTNTGVIHADSINILAKGTLGDVGFVAGTVIELVDDTLRLALPESEMELRISPDTEFVGTHRGALKTGDSVGVGYVQMFIGGAETYQATSIERYEERPDDPMPGPLPNPIDDPMPGPLPNPTPTDEPMPGPLPLPQAATVK